MHESHKQVNSTDKSAITVKWPLLEPRYFSGKPVLTVVQFCCLLLSSVVLCCPLLSFVVLCCPWWSSCSGCGNGCGAGLRGRQSPLENRIRTVCRDPERGPKRASRAPPRKRIRAVCRGQKRASSAPCRIKSGRYAKDLAQKGPRGGRGKVHHTT